jgi:hypothetical protein
MLQRSWKRWLVAVTVALIGAYAAVIFLACRTPQLSFSILVTQRAEHAHLTAMDIHNDAPWTVTLREAHVEFVPQAKIASIVSYVDPTATSACLASSAALDPDDCNPSRTGRVSGWRVSPTRPGANMHGLRIELPLEVDPGESTLVLSYRYLGWPFTLRQQVLGL